MHRLHIGGCAPGKLIFFYINHAVDNDFMVPTMSALAANCRRHLPIRYSTPYPHDDSIMVNRYTHPTFESQSRLVGEITKNKSTSTTHCSKNHHCDITEENEWTCTALHQLDKSYLLLTLFVLRVLLLFLVLLRLLGGIDDEGTQLSMVTRIKKKTRGSDALTTAQMVKFWWGNDQGREFYSSRVQIQADKRQRQDRQLHIHVQD